MNKKYPLRLFLVTYQNSTNPLFNNKAIKSPVKSSRSPLNKMMPSNDSGRNSTRNWTCLYAPLRAGNANHECLENFGTSVFISAENKGHKN